jgi:hypothetical protein
VRFEHVWPQMRALRSDEAASPELEWKVLYPFRARPLLLPADAPEQAHGAIALFVDSRLLRGLGHFLLWADRMLAGRILPTARLDEFPVGLLFGEDSGKAWPYAVQFGSPGPLSKLAVLSPGNGAAPGKMAKIALEASADQSVHREAYWLRMLGTTSAAPFLPKLLKHGVLSCGRAFITTSLLPPGASSPRFSAAHREFLARLARLSHKSARWSVQSAAERLRDRINAITQLLNPVLRAKCDAILAEIELGMLPRTVPACFVHGDFAAWNLRIAGGQLYVFDWEYAEANGNPLQDFLHFHLIARATRRRSVGPAYMRSLLAAAARHGRDLFGPASGVAEAAAPLALHYLLDTLTFYVEASNHLDVEHVVIKAYLRLLDERYSWFPRQPVGEVSHA